MLHKRRTGSSDTLAHRQHVPAVSHILSCHTTLYEHLAALPDLRKTQRESMFYEMLAMTVFEDGGPVYLGSCDHSSPSTNEVTAFPVL
ncbi:MAG TPA: hypothetical protein VHD63_24445 [Ktedonobacteraceae bacterium]|nr:hypothetical protein [Ktedonobacteraceae bacterium]